MYSIPNSIDEALTILKQDDWKILSGGTDFYPSMGDQPSQDNILDVSKILELREIRIESDGTVVIGALSTWTDLINADLPKSFDGLKLAAREVGSVQIQNRATIAGNICNASPAADGVPPLLILDPIVRLRSIKATRDVPLTEFILGNRKTCLTKDEMVTEIRIPASKTQGSSSFIKLGARKYLIISISMVAARIVVDEANIIKDIALSVGACSLVAKRLPELERTLIGEKLSQDITDLIINDHLNELSPIDDIRATKEFRMVASKELIARAIKSIAGKD